MNALETVRKWLEAFPQSGVLSGFQVDYTDKIPGTGGIMPDGLVEVRRSRDIVGDISVPPAGYIRSSAATPSAC